MSAAPAPKEDLHPFFFPLALSSSLPGSTGSGTGSGEGFFASSIACFLSSSEESSERDSLRRACAYPLASFRKDDVFAISFTAVPMAPSSSAVLYGMERMFLNFASSADFCSSFMPPAGIYNRSARSSIVSKYAFSILSVCAWGNTAGAELYPAFKTFCTSSCPIICVEQKIA